MDKIDKIFEECHVTDVDVPYVDLEKFKKEVRESFVEKNLRKIYGEYPCQHVQENVIDGWCPWCQLTVCEKSLENFREKYIKY